jgi:hypothetical protein
LQISICWVAPDGAGVQLSPAGESLFLAVAKKK